jgi:hypothetical protein
MGRDDMMQTLQEQPFQPFRIHLSTGLIYEISHPDVVFVGRSVIHIGVPPAGHSGVFGRPEKVSLIHIVRLEPVASESKSTLNVTPSRN